MESPFGKHILAEYSECECTFLDSEPDIRSLMLEAATRSGATVVGDIFHHFSPQGVTGVVVVAESHLAIHTWPEFGYASVDLLPAVPGWIRGLASNTSRKNCNPGDG